MPYDYDRLTTMRITQLLLAVTLGLLLVACEEDPDGGINDDQVDEIDAEPVDQTPDAGSDDPDFDAAPTFDAAPDQPDAEPPPDAAPPAVSFATDLLPIILT